MPPLSLNRPHLCPPKPTTWLVHWSCSNDFPGQVNSCPSRARCSAFMDRWCEPRLPKKKKYCSGLVPVRTRSPALSTATSKSGFSTYTGTAIWKWFDWKQPNRLSSITVHFQRSRELNPHGAETCVPTERKHCNADSSGRWGIAVRTFRRTDAVCFYTFFLCGPTKQRFTEIAKTST